MGKEKAPRKGAPAKFRFGGHSATCFGPETEFRGRLSFNENLKICGRFSGTVEAKGALYIEKGAVVEADHISVSSLIVAGTLNGSVLAVDSVELLPGAVLKGNITAARLCIGDGVLFEGQCQMTGVRDDVDIFSRPLADIKNELLEQRP